MQGTLTRIVEAAQAAPTVSERQDDFARRHIGPNATEQAAMLAELGFPTRAALVDRVVPADLRERPPLAWPPGCSEAGARGARRNGTSGLLLGKNNISYSD